MYCDQVSSKSVQWFMRYALLTERRRKKERKKEERKRNRTHPFCKRMCKERRKKELDMCPLPRARVKLGGWTRSPRFW